MAGNRGINARQSGTRIIVRELLLDNAGAKVVSGTTTVRCWELQTDGTLKTYDFSSNTFKASAITTSTATATHQTAPTEGAVYNTGLWDYVFSTVTGFTVGEIYIMEFSNTGASPVAIQRQFQYGGGDGDFVVTSGKVAATEGLGDNAALPAAAAGGKGGIPITDAATGTILQGFGAATIKNDLVDAPNATALTAIGTAVWAATTRTLSSFGTLVADVATAVWGATIRTLSAFGFGTPTGEGK